MISLWAVLYWLVVVLGLLALAGSFAGGLHPLGDSLAVGRSYLALGGLIWFGLGWATGLASALWMLVPLVAASSLAWARLHPQGPGGETAFYQKNMLFRMQDRAGFAQEMRDLAPDFVTLQEVRRWNAELIEGLGDTFPTRHYCAYSVRVGGTAVLSRWPAVEGSARCGLGVAAVQVEHPRLGKVWVASIHLPWPWPYRQAQHLPHVTELLSGLDGPVLIGGDFNMVPWSHALAQVAQASGSQRAGRAHQTYRYTGRMSVTLPIDHVLLPDTSTARSEARPFFGSDHRGVLIRF